MSLVRFIRKTPLLGGNYNYEYSCTCASGSARPNMTFTMANDASAQKWAQDECDAACGETLVRQVELLEIPTKELSADQAAIGPMKNSVGALEYTNYSFRDEVAWSGDRLYGSWATELGLVCSGQSTYGYYYQIQIVSGPESVGTCNAREVIKITTR